MIFEIHIHNNMPILLSATMRGIEIFDEYESVKKEAERLTAEGVNKIIALGSAGLPDDLKIAEIPGIDVVIGGDNRIFGKFMWTGLCYVLYTVNLESAERLVS